MLSYCELSIPFEKQSQIVSRPKVGEGSRTQRLFLASTYTPRTNKLCYLISRILRSYRRRYYGSTRPLYHPSAVFSLPPWFHFVCTVARVMGWVCASRHLASRIFTCVTSEEVTDLAAQLTSTRKDSSRGIGPRPWILESFHMGVW